MNSSLEDDYIKFIYDTSWYVGAHTDTLEEVGYLSLGLAGETGEAVDEVKKVARDHGLSNNTNTFIELAKPKQVLKLIDELADANWYLTRMLDVLKLDREELMIINLWKLYHRLKADNKIPEETPWPLEKHIPYEDVSKLMQRIESPTTEASVSTSTDIDT